MLQLSHVKKIYDKTEVLSDISYTFEEGRLYPILGGAGAGRTTLFECICGDLTTDGGTVVSEEKADLFFAAKQSVLPMYISGEEFIRYLCEFQREAQQPEVYLDRVKLDKTVRGRLICEYTFEDKKRLQLAAFLVQRPHVILFDEPLDYCSEEYIDTFLEVLREESKGHVVLISTGILNMARRIAPDILVLNNGELNEVAADMIDIPEIKRAILDILGELEE